MELFEKLNGFDELFDSGFVPQPRCSWHLRRPHPPDPNPHALPPSRPYTTPVGACAAGVHA
jgi:hypothetical protein